MPAVTIGTSGRLAEDNFQLDTKVAPTILCYSRLGGWEKEYLPRLMIKLVLDLRLTRVGPIL